MSKLRVADSTQAKETIYVDVDDEITVLIDKVTSSKAKIVALVLPKRATVMQSIVNMKLLKHRSDEAGKKVVLITSEAALMPLAGLADMYVAQTPTSRPEIPKAPNAVDDVMESIEEPADATSTDEEFNPRAVAAVPIGQLASEVEDPILMSEQGEEGASDDNQAKIASTVPTKLNKKLKVPSFNKFRLGMILGVVALILLITGWIFAFNVLPKAGIAITTDGSTITSDLNLTLSTDAKTVDLEKSILPAIAQTSTKTSTEETPATGQLNNGKKASGSIVIVASVCTLPAKKPASISAGTAVTNSSHAYITQETASFDQTPKLSNDGSCLMYTSNSVDITALKAGTAFNTENNASFAVKSSYVGSGSATGGTDEIVKVLAQNDIDAAREKLATQDATEVKATLTDELSKKNYLAVDTTFVAGEPQITTSANVGDKVESVKVTSTVQYTMLGIKEDDLATLLDEQLKDKINEGKQKILENGLDKIKFGQETPGTPTSAVVTAKIKTVVGPKIEVDKLRERVVGEKAADVKEIIRQTPGVTDVEVAYSPFWVTRVPNDPKKVTIIIDGKTY